MDDSVRYQVFISSTFEDLVDERKAVIKSLLSFGYMPSGMEMFPSTDSEQFEYIENYDPDSEDPETLMTKAREQYEKDKALREEVIRNRSKNNSQ
jgi:hypothetical protein